MSPAHLFVAAAESPAGTPAFRCGVRCGVQMLARRCGGRPTTAGQVGICRSRLDDVARGPGCKAEAHGASHA
ncbi:MAG: hypothetical protein KGZ43_11540 [Sulfuritalea sp.]|nr:hypothetical protein [Sulfuritalea sp.]